jgi:glutathione peroxidase-family protein
MTKYLYLCVTLFLATSAHALEFGSEEYYDAVVKLPPEYIEKMERGASSYIAKACEQKWGNNYEMQVYCRQNENEAARSFYATARKITSALKDPATRDNAEVMTEIQHTCFNKWQGKFEMIVYCFKNQAAAYKQLQESGDGQR